MCWFKRSRALHVLITARNVTNFMGCRKDTAILGPPLYLGLPMEHRLSLTGALAGDLMHAPTLNIGDLMVPLWRGMFECEKTDRISNWPWAVMKGDVWINHGKAIACVRQYICLVPMTTLLGISLVSTIRVHQLKIPADQLITAQKNLDEFHVGFENLHCQVNPLKAILPELEKPTPAAAYTSVNFGGGYKLLMAQERYAHAHLGCMGVALQSYMIQEHGADEDGYVNIKIRWSNPHSTWKEGKKPAHKVRNSCCVKLTLGDQIEYAEVLFYFVDDTDKGRAVVLLYSRPDEELLWDSFFTLYSITQLPQEVGLRVVEVQSILAVVSMQPHEHYLEQGERCFFVWEKFGLEISILNGCTEAGVL
ncbi:hypothetical protein K439DRAFT_1619360 [Ramaria rubella]|nr:hypothetical protein K439DRAFT_1619360 [Ramaria rubella]